MKSTLTYILGCIATVALVVGMSLIPTGRADAAGRGVTGAPRPGVPVVQVDSAHRPVPLLRTVYVEHIADARPGHPAYSYVQYNSGAAQLVRDCRTRAALSCVEPHTGTMHLDDGSFVYLARWAR